MRFVMGLAGALIAGMIADRKNRNVLAWALFGALTHVFAIVVLFFLPCLCPMCRQPLTNQQATGGACPSCGGKADDPG